MKKKDTSWDSVAGWYDGMLTDDESYQTQVIAPNLLRLMALRPGQKVLDLACGTGFFSGLFAQAIGPENVTGADIGKKLIVTAQKNNPAIDFKVAPAHDLSVFPSGHFDKVAVVLAIQNIAEIKEMLAEIGRVTKPNASVYIVMNHPAFRIPKRSGWAFDQTTGRQYRRIDGYLHETKEQIDMKPGSAQDSKPNPDRITVSFHRPLQYYLKLFAAAGLAVTRLEEWISHKHSQAGPRQKEEDRMRGEIPLFLFMEIRKFSK